MPDWLKSTHLCLAWYYHSYLPTSCLTDWQLLTRVMPGDIITAAYLSPAWWPKSCLTDSCTHQSCLNDSHLLTRVMPGNAITIFLPDADVIVRAHADTVWIIVLEERSCCRLLDITCQMKQTWPVCLCDLLYTLSIYNIQYYTQRILEMILNKFLFRTNLELIKSMQNWFRFFMWLVSYHIQCLHWYKFRISLHNMSECTSFFIFFF